MPEAIYNELSITLENYIAEHGITGKLPGLHKLAAILSANHITVRKAVELLVAEGKLEVVPSSGTFVCAKAAKKTVHNMIGVLGLYNEEHFRQQLFKQLNDELALSGRRVMDIANNPELFHENPRLLLQFPVDGYIFFGSSLSRKTLDALLAKGFPVICTINPNFPEVNHVGLDHIDAYHRVLRLLRQRGCRRIAFLGYERPKDFANYLEDIRSVFGAVLGAQFEPRLFSVYCGAEYFMRYGERYHEEIVRETLPLWKSLRPDAVVTIPQIADVLRHFAPTLEIAEFGLLQSRFSGRINACEDSMAILRTAVNRMLELLAGDTSVRETRLPFLIRERGATAVNQLPRYNVATPQGEMI